MYEILFDDPDLEKGTVVTVDGIGELQNGEPRKLSDEEVEQFGNRNGVVESKTVRGKLQTEFVPANIEDAGKGNPFLSVKKVGGNKTPATDDKKKEGDK